MNLADTMDYFCHHSVLSFNAGFDLQQDMLNRQNKGKTFLLSSNQSNKKHVRSFSREGRSEIRKM